MDATYRKLLTYAYNIMGSVDDAKDVVQDVMEKYIHLDKSKIEHLPVWSSTMRSI